MSALNLPKPVNTFAGEDELRKPNGNATASGSSSNGNGAGDVNGEMGEEDMGEYRPPRPSDKYRVGMIYPAREIRAIIDKTAIHISKNPTPAALEEKIKENRKADPKFAFLNDEDPYHLYYKYMIEKTREDAEDAEKGIAQPTAAVVEVKEEAFHGYEPRSFEFKVDLPGVTAMDLDILRLTALFHARRGRSFLSSLSVREGRNYQFDFLRPTHSLYGYYNRMVESYQKIMQPPPGQIEHIVKQASDPNAKWSTLEEGRNRAEWERGRRKKADAVAKEKDEEAMAMATIDWQDFVLVETIEFTQNDMELELPPPTSVDKLQGMSMAEKRMASMIMEETGAGPTGHGGTVAGQDAVVAADEMEMDEEEEEEVRLQRIRAEQEQARAREVQRAAMESRGMKIKKDYVPKGINRGGSTAVQKCPYCGEMIPENELSEHIRIELLDPKWKEQKKQLEMRRAQHVQLQQGSEISASLRNLAQARTDLFGDEVDEAERKRREEEDKQKRREREKIIWDGHTASAATTSDKFQTQFTLDAQIKQMHHRMGLTWVLPPPSPGGEYADSRETAPGGNVGPQAGPGIAPAPIPSPVVLPPALVASLPKPAGGVAYEGAAISAAPTGPSASSGPSIHPSRQAAIAASSSALPPRPSESAPPPAPVAGVTRPAPDADEPFSEPMFKRPKVDKLLFGQMYSEIDWVSLHPDPIAIAVQLPTNTERREWKLDGSTITVPDLPVNTHFSVVRERIKRVLNADLPISRMRLEYDGKVMNNGSSLASVNLEEGDTLVLTLKKK